MKEGKKETKRRKINDVLRTPVGRFKSIRRNKEIDWFLKRKGKKQNKTKKKKKNFTRDAQGRYESKLVGQR